MDAVLHTFIDVFSSEFECENGEFLKLTKISIPRIQRDYAQGRIDPIIDRTRKNFIKRLHSALVDNPVTLDFVYGRLDKNGTLIPLDGQQRLTTLFLLHWYAAKKDNLSFEEYEFLTKFSYETRYSARDFCSFLVNFNPDFKVKISEEIINQSWFPLEWKKDPTISSMLVVIDAIHDEFKEETELWKKLNTDSITFYFLPINELQLTDELYIKMNSRGKPLTMFEHFKAELEGNLRQIDSLYPGHDFEKRIISKFDIQWTDMLWTYRDKKGYIDDFFLHYFSYICDIICYKNGGTHQGKNYDEFDLLDIYFSVVTENVIDNVDFLEKCFDVWVDLCSNGGISNFFGKFFSNSKYIEGKVTIDYEIDLFHECLVKNGLVSGNGNRRFPLNRVTFLYATIMYLLNKDNISEEQFLRRIRIINNLISNSEFELSDSETRSGGNRMPAILKQVDQILLTGAPDITGPISFNDVQLTEEIEKLQWLELHPEYQEQLFKLEDHPLLYGRIGIVGLDSPELFEKFALLFKCDWSWICKALVATGNYLQSDRRSWRYQLGSGQKDKAWKNLFHFSKGSTNFEGTKECLKKLLEMSEISNSSLRAICKTYTDACEEKNEFDWRYYFVKYPIFTSDSYGKYYWTDFEHKPYEVVVMKTENNLSEYSYQPFLASVDAGHISKKELGMVIEIDGVIITCLNDRYEFTDAETGTPVTEPRIIKQNENGVDIEDRVHALKIAYRKFSKA